MATSRDLFLAILALDSYNRGYNPGLKGLDEAAGTQVGTETIVVTTEDTHADVAFYAAAYEWNNTTVISYRGTTFEAGPNLKDVFYGWTLSAGFSAATQLRRAAASVHSRSNPSAYPDSGGNCSAGKSSGVVQRSALCSGLRIASPEA
jgi:hypothetical protein